MQIDLLSGAQVLRSKNSGSLEFPGWRAVFSGTQFNLCNFVGLSLIAFSYLCSCTHKHVFWVAFGSVVPINQQIFTAVVKFTKFTNHFNLVRSPLIGLRSLTLFSRSRFCVATVFGSAVSNKRKSVIKTQWQ
jgi:hypothetical protein